ncbi:MAG: hypothetical protein ACRD3N_07460 [Terracidiphilus sp.]
MELLQAPLLALGTGVLDAFTIGAESQQEQDNLVSYIAAAQPVRASSRQRAGVTVRVPAWPRISA